LIDPLITMRVVHFASTVMVAGATLFVCFIAEPAFQAVGEPPWRVVRPFRGRLFGLLSASLVLAVVSGAGWLLLLAAKIGNQSLSEAITEGTAWVLLTQTRFGLDWQLRLLLAVLLAGSLLLERRTPSRWLDLFAALAGSIFIAALAWAGHGAATSGIAGDVHLGADIFHLIAAGAWLGGLIPFVLLVRLLRHSDEPGWATIACAVVSRFSNLGIIAVGTLLVSGTINAWFLVGGPVNWTGTGYGRLLQLKIALFVGMICLAAVNRQYLMPHLSADISGYDPERRTRTARKMERNAMLEVTLGLAVVVVVAMLGITQPATEAHVHVH